MTPDAAAARALHRIKLVHSASWAVLAGSIVAIPAAAWVEAWTLTAVLMGLVTLECLVLVLSGMRRPLTAVAARYTDERQAKFDIQSPS